MIKVAGFWDLHWNTPIKEIDLWEYPLRDFGVDQHYMIPISGIDNKKVHERQEINEVLDKNRDMTIIFCDERANTLLKDFEHPENALYVFGKANYSPFLNLAREGDLSLKIETVRPQGGLLWGHQAASIILYDRLMKGVK